MKHPVIDDLMWRYTSKKYDSTRKVAEKDLDVIFEAMRLSASSINSQPWKFIVLESDQAKQRMHDTFANQHQFNQPHVKESSHFILFAHKPDYSRDDFDGVVDKYIQDGRVKEEDREKAYGACRFIEMNTDESGNNSAWTMAQLYLALGNTMHTLARLKIDSTPIEGIDTELVNKEFAKELDGYCCPVALAIGYHHPTEDYNTQLPKSRLKLEDVLLRI
ncbi:MAG: NAD(P)H-dependent oxidoreductase [Gammaproteobacteria bacterium]|nr:NAD(P)H-dependent oxidoreductase [Gammaproteobacteria bacterium]